jgi:hypothetical protein
MRRHFLRDLPREFRDALLGEFPPISGSEHAELLWLSATDFPRLRHQDLLAEHPVFIISPRRWRLADSRSEQQVEALEPLVVLPAVRSRVQEPSPSFRARLVAGAACVALFGLVVMVSSPRQGQLLQAEGVKSLPAAQQVTPESSTGDQVPGQPPRDERPDRTPLSAPQKAPQSGRR